MDLTGGDLQEITSAGNENPAVSPDGTRISVIDETDTGKSLWLTNIDGRDPRQLLPPEFDIATKHDWAPDGRHLFVGGNANGLHPDDSANIATIRPDGSRLHYLTHYHDPTVHALPGTYSPDGKYIVFRLEDPDSAALMVMRSDGSDVRQIRGGFTTSGFKPRFRDWGPSKTRPR
jgi:Tol biopolymer transport system component